jgi:hypothetical protein
MAVGTSQVCWHFVQVRWYPPSAMSTSWDLLTNRREL